MNKHSYIDIEKVRDFRDKKEWGDIWNDLNYKYKIINVYDDDEESMTYLCDALYSDYEKGIANYEAYLEHNMDARIMMELRKSAVLWFSEEFNSFYMEHNICNTVDEIKKIRIKYIKPLCDDYKDLDWQLFYLIHYSLGKKAEGFLIDYESCFADGNWKNQTNPDDYVESFVDAHMLGYNNETLVV